MPLSPRLAAIAALVPPGRAMADIGTDHGRLPASLLAGGHVPRAIGIDDKPRPLAGARARGGALELRLGSGCRPLAPGEVHTLTLAGMGGRLIARILAEGTAGAARLVVQPNGGEGALRAWLAGNGWIIDVERIVEDGGRLFAIFAALRSQGTSRTPPDAAELAYGAVHLHLDRATLARRLRDDEARLRALLPGAVTDRGRRALNAQLEVVALARERSASSLVDAATGGVTAATAAPRPPPGCAPAAAAR